MDSDFLSNEAYKAIILEADKFSDNLTPHFGILAADCKDEKEYLEAAKELIAEIRKMNKWELDDFFFGEPPDQNSLHQALDRILANISKVESTPESNRHYDF